ncbi:MAG: hypothetical protein ACLT5P_15260 [Flavonifractor plautii]
MKEYSQDIDVALMMHGSSPTTVDVKSMAMSNLSPSTERSPMPP